MGVGRWMEESGIDVGVRWDLRVELGWVGVGGEVGIERERMYVLVSGGTGRNRTEYRNTAHSLLLFTERSIQILRWIGTT